MLTCLPLAITAEPDATSPWSPEPVAFPWLDVDKQRDGAVWTAAGDLHRNPCLRSAERRIIRKRASPARPSQSGWRPAQPSAVAAGQTTPSASGRSGSRFRRRSQDDHACPSWLRARSSSGRTRSRATRGGAEPHCSRTSSSCDSGEKMASAWPETNTQDARRESASPISAKTPIPVQKLQPVQPNDAPGTHFRQM